MLALPSGTRTPVLNNGPREALYAWLRANKFTDWQVMLDAIHPSWHDSLDLVLPSYRHRVLTGRGLPRGFTLAVPEFWFQRAELTLENVTVSGGTIIRKKKLNAMCAGERTETACIDQTTGKSYKQARVIIK